MRTLKLLLVLVVISALCVSGMAFAAGSYQGGGHSGGYRGGGGHGGDHGGGGHHGGHWGHHGGSDIDFVIGGPFWGWPWYYPYYYPYYSYPYYSYPYYYPYGSAVSEPQEYIQRSEEEYSSEPSGVWYYCPASKAYYPYVRKCPGGWQTVPAQPQPESER